MRKHLVLVGAGHVHLTALKNLRAFVQQGHTVTVVNAAAYHYYSGMGPGMLAGRYQPEAIRFHVKKMAEDRGGRFIEDRGVRIDARAKRLCLRSGQTIGYDVMSCNTGSAVPVEQEMASSEAVFTVKPIEKLLNIRAAILEKLRQNPRITITVAGGGATGIEIAANVRTLVENAPGKADIYLIAGTRLAARFAEKVRAYALDSLTTRSVTVQEGVRLQHVKDGIVTLSDGTSFSSDIVIMAVGTRPSSLFVESAIPTGDDGGLLVNQYLQSVEYPGIFGGGDCITFQPRPLERIGVYAVRENPILFHNLLVALNGGAFQTFSPQRSYVQMLNMGDGTGILFRNSLVIRGKFVFWLKHAIDMAFMRRFQVSGEQKG